MNKKSFLFKYLAKHKLRYVKGLFLLIIINFLQVLVPRITGQVVDGLESLSLDSRKLLYYGGILILISLMTFIAHFLSRLQVAGASNLFDYEVRNGMFDHMLKLSMKFFHRNRVGELMALATNDLGSLRMILSRGFNLMTNTVILLISSIVIMVKYVDPRLTLYSFLPLPILVFIMTKFGPMINRRFRRVQESFSDVTRKTTENITGIRVVKAFVQEDYEKENFAKVNQENFDINMNLVKLQGIFYPLINVISSLSFLIAFIYGGNLIITNQISLGDFIAFNGYLGIIIRPVMSIGMIINFTQRAKASVERIEELFDEKPEVVDPAALNPGKEHIEKDFYGRIEFNDLTFSYGKTEPDVLKNIDLVIEPGKTLGVIGKVGSGKSTIVNLILRLYDPAEKGQLLIDGEDITETSLKRLRDNIGYIPQDNFLFSSSIRENIGFSPNEPTLDEIRGAAAMSQIDESIMELSDQYETMLGERGVNLSGGQKQRVSIARALVKDPKILILDDCLSAVDTDTERKILNELKPFMEERTCVIIAHRISSLQDADEIIVLDDGRIIERGSHEELLEQQGYYNRIYQRQLLEEEIEIA
ncbi:MAG TPA: ABC transporter ATP-binding protein [Clostridia bacterium]|nr:ABC transporter ATP-binding protein [Clostridia bacterium]